MRTAVGIMADSKQQGPPFDPTVLPGLRAWFDAADTSSIVHLANAVSQWTDKSSNLFHVTQAIEANKPITGTTNINGKNTLNFNGTSQFLTRASPVQIVHPTTGEWSAYTVFRTQNVTGVHHVLDQDAVTGTVTRCAIYCRTGTTNLQAVAFDTTPTVFQDTTPGIAINGISYTSCIRGPTSVDAFRNGASNGALATTGIPQTSGGYNLGIGASRTGGTAQFWWQGEIGEIIVYDVAHSSTDRVKVQNYLKAKWGL